VVAGPAAADRAEVRGLRASADAPPAFPDPLGVSRDPGLS